MLPYNNDIVGIENNPRTFIFVNVSDIVTQNDTDD